MIEEAIKHLENNALAKAINEAFGKDKNFDGNIVALAQGLNIASLELHKPNRDRFRGTFSTELVSDYVTVVREQAIGRSFIDAESMSATHIFNMGTIENAGHCDHKAVLKLRQSAALKAIRSIVGKRLSQLELSDWVQEWADFVTCTGDNGESMTVAKAVAAFRNIDIAASSKKNNIVSNFGASQSAFESVAASSTEILPGWIVFKCIPYDSLQPRNFSLRVSVIVGDKPQLVLRLEREELHNEEMANEFKNLLIERITGAFPSTEFSAGNTIAPVVIGKFTP